VRDAGRVGAMASQPSARELAGRTEESIAAGILGIVVSAAVMASAHAETVGQLVVAVLATLLVYWAADEADTGGRDALPAIAAAKAQVADTVVSVTNEAMTLVGGLGYRDRYPMERHLRDARASHVMSPTTDILRTWTGRALLDVPLLGT